MVDDICKLMAVTGTVVTQSNKDYELHDRIGFNEEDTMKSVYKNFDKTPSNASSLRRVQRECSIGW